MTYSSGCDMKRASIVRSWRQLKQIVRRLMPHHRIVWFGLVVQLLSGAASLQAQMLRITEPAEWKDGRPAIIKPGQSMRVAGTATHPAGVLKILVNGQEAFLEPDRDYPEIFRFEKLLSPSTELRTVSITI